ncbi:hypothetical protein [Sediminicurvatus halobius]|uniref:ABC transporter substrate-binding protein n=1 Tax=Sediminicurvatus halobius TaxID=2182432 RepID=A0A2U2N112_9GAMM|nr:hypothetical protein [Spiribacter halobius]PWG62925.1 hypothetical protein DEM34_09995 [Spiribacter halobius]UEX77436.1 hypothetical protein LMH63_16075 [Spiribacter halobius]
MRRRDLLRLALLLPAVLPLLGHTPYRQWQVYRRKHLLIGSHRVDEPTYPLGQRLAEVLARELPESRARVTRAPNAWRLASLIATDQLQVVLLSGTDAEALRDGRDGFESFGRTELRALFRFGPHWLITRPDFPGWQAYLVVEALAGHARELGGEPAAAHRDPPVPVHAGALAYARGEPPPERVE